jgi:predicted nucleotidyltransferase
MTQNSLPSTLKVSEERPLHPVTLAMLRHVRDTAVQLGSEFVIAGATARDIVLWHVYGMRAERATKDVDVAVCAVSWGAHGELVKKLESTGHFKRSERVEHSLLFVDPADGKSIALDLVPFGPLETPAGTIMWPKDKNPMKVLGFREAVDTALKIAVGDGLVVPVVTLPALMLLKILAWHDRRTKKNTDAPDMYLIMRNYFEAGNSDRIWEAAPGLLELHGFDTNLASAALLGRDAWETALPATREAVIPLLRDVKSYETLRADMLARAAAVLLDGFVDGTARTLAAFRDGFLQSADPGA